MATKKSDISESQNFSPPYAVYTLPEKYEKKDLYDAKEVKNFTMLVIHRLRSGQCDHIDCIRHWNELDLSRKIVKTVYFNTMSTKESFRLDFCLDCFQKKYPNCFKPTMTCQNKVILTPHDPCTS
jgi:hypothetical protein